MLTVFHPAHHRSERTDLSRQTFGSVRIAQKDQKSIRINPTRKTLACASPSRSSTSIVCTTNALGARQRLRRRSGISPLYDVKKSASRFAGGKDALSMDAVWWSQTGSNRRPPACKAGALPTELWPQSRRPIAHQRQAIHRRPNTRTWWAWEDLNFRPHAYQARALTN